MQYEERVTLGDLTVRENGVVISEARGPAPAQRDAARADVQPMVADALAGLPATWMADGIQPDEAALGAWMQQQLDTSGGLLMFRRSRDTYAAAERYLKDQGVDVGRALERAEDAQDAATSRTRADAADIRDLALDLKKAESKLLSESRGFNEGAAGFTSAKLGEARERVDRLTAELRAACLDDPALARAARRAAG